MSETFRCPACHQLLWDGDPHDDCPGPTMRGIQPDPRVRRLIEEAMEAEDRLGIHALDG